MKWTTFVLCIGLSVFIVWTECSPVNESKSGSASVVKDLKTAASNKYDDKSEISHENDRGYLKKSDEKGGDGYEHFESFHNKDGDSYGYEKHDAYGNDKKHEGGGAKGKKGGSGGGKEDHSSGSKGGYGVKSSGYQYHEDEDDGKGNQEKGTKEYGPDKHSSYSYSYSSDDDDDDDDKKNKADEYSYDKQHDSGSEEHGNDEGDDEENGHDEDDDDDSKGHSSYSYGSDGEDDEEDSYYSPSHYKEDKSSGGGFEKYLSDNFRENEEDEESDDDDDDKPHSKDDDDEDEEEHDDDKESRDNGKSSKHGTGPKASVSYKTNHGHTNGKPVHTFYGHHNSPYKTASDDHGKGHANTIRTKGYETHVVHVVHKAKPEVKHEDHQSYTSGAPSKATASDGKYQVIEHHAHTDHATAPHPAKLNYKNKHPLNGVKKYQNDAGPDYSYGQQFIYASDADFDASY